MNLFSTEVLSPITHIRMIETDANTIIPTMGNEIMTYLSARQHSFRRDASYLDNVDVTIAHRDEEVKWMQDISYSQDFNGRTLFVAVDVMDRYYSKVDAIVSKMRVVSAACLWIANKLEDVDSDITSAHWWGKYNIDPFHVIKEEMVIMSTLNGVLNSPLTYEFVKWGAIQFHQNPEIQLDALELAEKTLFSLPLCAELASFVAAACLTVVCHRYGMESAELIVGTALSLDHGQVELMATQLVELGF